MRVKIDPADRAFSQYVRLRDMRCMRCSSTVKLNDEGMPISHQASHYFGRGRENTRFDNENVDTLCGACHRLWGSDDKEGYRDFKVNQLGQDGFDRLKLRASLVKKKDRKLSLLEAKMLLSNISES